jgi:hypothetical protein
MPLGVVIVHRTPNVKLPRPQIKDRGRNDVIKMAAVRGCWIGYDIQMRETILIKFDLQVLGYIISAKVVNGQVLSHTLFMLSCLC